MTLAATLMGLLIAGLTASQQISTEEASGLVEAADLQGLASSLRLKPIDWRLAADTASALPDVSLDTAIGCASGTISVDALTKVANMHAIASLARRQDLTVHGQEAMRDERLKTEQEERSVARLTTTSTLYTDLIRQGQHRTVCVLISGSKYE